MVTVVLNNLLVEEMAIGSEGLVTELEARTRILWSLVRCSVVTLWRSKVHAGGAECPVVNRLHLVFQDGLCVSLQQDDLVAEMAEQHQAAPCEYQILAALRQRVLNSMEDSGKSVKLTKAAKSLAKKIRKESPSPVRIISLHSWGTNKFSTNFYASTGMEERPGAYVLFQSLGPLVGGAEGFYAAFLSSFAKKVSSVRPVEGLFCHACADSEAASITMMQHIAYQGRLNSTFGTLSSKVAKTDVICGQGVYDVKTNVY